MPVFSSTDQIIENAVDEIDSLVTELEILEM